MHVLPVLLLAYEAKVLLLHQSAMWRMAVWSIYAANLLAKKKRRIFSTRFYFQFFDLCTLGQFYWMERDNGIEPSPTAWRAAVLPLHQSRIFAELSASTTNPLVYDSEHRRGAPLLLILMPSWRRSATWSIKSHFNLLRTFPNLPWIESFHMAMATLVVVWPLSGFSHQKRLT